LPKRNQVPTPLAPRVINTDRPAITDSTTVAPAGYFIFDNGLRNWIAGMFSALLPAEAGLRVVADQASFLIDRQSAGR
jgi:hypothetical protein